jgi:hypothetical protein
MIRGGDLHNVIDLLFAVQKRKNVVLAVAPEDLVDVFHDDNKRTRWLDPPKHRQHGKRDLRVFEEQNDSVPRDEAAH